MVNLTIRHTYPTRPRKRPRSTLESDNRVERQRMYNTKEWRELRKAKLIDQPLCEVCLSNSHPQYRVAEHVHHLHSFMNASGEERRKLALDYNNLCSICHHCHSQYHGICEANRLEVNHTPKEMAELIETYNNYTQI